MGDTRTVVWGTSSTTISGGTVAVEGGNTEEVAVSLGSEKVELASTTNESFLEILTELKLVTHLLNEGLNTKENLDTLREDYESELGG
jgi:hypothetical protein